MFLFIRFKRICSGIF